MWHRALGERPVLPWLWLTSRRRRYRGGVQRTLHQVALLQVVPLGDQLLPGVSECRAASSPPVRSLLLLLIYIRTSMCQVHHRSTGTVCDRSVLRVASTVAVIGVEPFEDDSGQAAFE